MPSADRSRRWLVAELMAGVQFTRNDVVEARVTLRFAAAAGAGIVVSVSGAVSQGENTSGPAPGNHCQFQTDGDWLNIALPIAKPVPGPSWLGPESLPHQLCVTSAEPT